jgi:pimeloyl-ACP methyl ester carboxylesterase
MIPVVLALTGAFTGGAIILGKNFLYPLTRLTSWDAKQWPIKFTSNGISYIYDQPECSTVIIFSHGNGGNLTDRQYIRDFCKNNNYGLILYDYYGYGASSYLPTFMINEGSLQKSIYEILCLIGPDKRIILVGESLGCYPTCCLASHIPYKIFKVILCMPFDRLSTITLLGSYILGTYNNSEYIQGVISPTMIIQGSRDEIIPISCGKNLSERCPGIKSLCMIDTGHNDYFNIETQQLIDNFIRGI